MFLENPRFSSLAQMRVNEWPLLAPASLSVLLSHWSSTDATIASIGPLPSLSPNCIINEQREHNRAKKVLNEIDYLQKFRQKW